MTAILCGIWHLLSPQRHSDDGVRSATHSNAPTRAIREQIAGRQAGRQAGTQARRHADASTHASTQARKHAITQARTIRRTDAVERVESLRAKLARKADAFYVAVLVGTASSVAATAGLVARCPRDAGVEGGGEGV